jgi:predicted AAA+ superfamily ATPase
VKKEQKLYLWDWSLIPDKGAKFENFVACQLLKYCHFQEDTEGYRMELRFLRDTDRREVDFVVLRDRRPLFAVECKVGERDVSPAIPYFQERTAIPKFYQVHLGKTDLVKGGTRVLPFHTFCRELGMP